MPESHSSQMLVEVRQQPEALAKSFTGGLRAAVRLRKAIEKNRPRLIVLAARGTSDNAAQFGRYLLEITTGIPVSLAAPSVVTVYGAKLDLRETLVVAISQSGESTDINLVLERAKAQGAMTVGITNESSSELAALAEHAFLVKAGKEKSVAATKTYSGQLLMLYFIAWALGGKIDLELLRRMPEWAAAALTLESEIGERAIRYRFMEHAVVVGRGLNYANAFEFALKLMETCYVVAERFSSADFQHGPIAMVEASFPVFLFAPDGAIWDGTRKMLTRLQELKAEILLISDASHRDLPAGGNAIVIPARLGRGSARSRDLYTPIPYIIPGQLFAALLAAEKGLNPDQPRTLTKVTRTI